MTTDIAQFMKRLERTWDEHVDALLTRRDVDAAMISMTAKPSLRHLPTNTGADGRAELERFYRDSLLPYLPGEFRTTRRARVVDRFRLVDELRSPSCTTVSWSGCSRGSVRPVARRR